MKRQQALVLRELNLTDAAPEAWRRTVEELQALMRANLPVYLKRFYGPKRAQEGTPAELRAAIDEAFRHVLDRNPARRARFFVGLIVRDHFNQVIYRTLHDYAKEPFTVTEMTTRLLDYATKARGRAVSAGPAPGAADAVQARQHDPGILPAGLSARDACDAQGRSRSRAQTLNERQALGISRKGGNVPARAYRRGKRGEGKARTILESEGYYVIRSAGSKGLWDLVAYKRINF
jgi:hypothetical protein